MFDNITHTHPVQRITEKVAITVNRAPTDESIQLAEDMRQKIQDRLVFENYYGTDTGFNVHVVIMKPISVSFVTSYFLVYITAEINGKKYTREEKISKEFRELFIDETHHTFSELQPEVARFLYYNIMIMITGMIMQCFPEIEQDLYGILCQKWTGRHINWLSEEFRNKVSSL